MINCLSSSKFANLLFVNVQIGNVNAIALFDTGAAGIRFSGRPRLAAGAGVQASAMRDFIWRDTVPTVYRVELPNGTADFCWP